MNAKDAEVSVFKICHLLYLSALVKSQDLLNINTWAKMTKRGDIMLTYALKLAQMG